MPKGAAAILLGVGAITAGEPGRPLAANLAVTTTVARMEGELDEATYRARPER